MSDRKSKKFLQKETTLEEIKKDGTLKELLTNNWPLNRIDFYALLRKKYSKEVVEDLKNDIDDLFYEQYLKIL